MTGLAISLLLLAAPDEAAGPTLDELLAQVRSHHPLFTREARRVDVEREAQRAAGGLEDWYLRSSGRYAFQRPVQTNPFVPEEIQNVSFDVGVERPIWSTGGRAGISWAGSYLRQSTAAVTLGPGFALPRQVADFYETGLFLTYSQPLLKNLGGTLDQLPYEIASFSVELAELTAAENQEGYLLQISGRYVDWALLVAQRDVAAERLELAKSQLKLTKRKRAQNLVDAVDVLRGEDAVQTARQALVLLQSQIDATRGELAVLAGVDSLPEAPQHDLYATVELPAADAELDEVIVGTRLVRASQTTRAQVAAQLGGADEQTSPELNLDLGVGARGFDDSSPGEALVTSEPDAAVMLSFRYPLGNEQAEAEAERIRLLVAQSDDRTAEVKLQLESALRGLLVQLAEMQKVLAIDRDQIVAAEKKAAEELALYNRGRSNLTFVIQARDDVQRAKLNYAQNAASYQKLLLQYREAVDELRPD